MASIRGVALALVLLRYYTVYADFGIPPVIAGVTSLVEYGTNIVNEATDVEHAFGDIFVDGPVVEFNEAGLAVTAVYTQIVSLIKPIAQAVSALAVNDVGTVEALFGAVDTKINTMRTFIASGALPLLATVETKVSVYVRNELNDILTTMNVALGDLKTALAQLRTGVINARTQAASNGGVYTSSNMQNNVKSSLVFTVQSRMLQLQSTVPSAVFSAMESARTINQANVFMQIGETVASGVTLKELWEGQLLTDYERVRVSFQDVELLMGAELPIVNNRLGQIGPEFAAVTGPAFTLYGEVEHVFNQVTAGVPANLLNAYKKLTESALGYVAEVLQNFYPPIEPSIRRLSEILVQRSPYADYCYEAYYPKVEQYLYAGEMTILTCLDDELTREKTLVDALTEVIYQLQFFLEDTNAYLRTCYRLSLFDEQLANDCLAEHQAFSEIIPCTTMKEYATLLQLLCKEVDSIRFRLWACMSRDTFRFPIEASDMLTSIETCRVHGPYAPI